MLDWLKGEDEALADLNYLGHSGITQKCKRALETAVTGRGVPDEVVVIRNGEARALLLVTGGDEDETIIMPGFAEGYSGEGPDGFAWAMSYLEDKGVDHITARDVPDAMMRRLEKRNLTAGDVMRLRDKV